MQHLRCAGGSKGWTGNAGRASGGPSAAHYDMIANFLERNANLAGNGLSEHGGRLEAGEEQRVADAVHDLAADFAFGARIIGDLPILIEREHDFNFALETEGR